MEALFTVDGLIALLTLTILEIVLGIDNIIFISIVSNKLELEERKKARNIGLAGALLLRVALLLGITWIIKLTAPVFTVYEHPVSWRDIILAAGGLFLLAKSTSEIHHKIEGEDEGSENRKKPHSLSQVILQIILLDIVFSFDSILTAIGLAKAVSIMITAIVISMFVMMAFAGKISDFIAKHPTLQILALSFLILIGFVLVMESLHQEVPKGYIYFSVAFSLIVEMINMRFRKKRKARPIK